MFNVQINNRLKDIKGSSLTFGGLSVLSIEDIFQLQPELDGYNFIFKHKLWTLMNVVSLPLISGKSFSKCLN